MRSFSQYKMNKVSQATRTLRELQKQEISVHYRLKVEQLQSLLSQ